MKLEPGDMIYRETGREVLRRRVNEVRGNRITLGQTELLKGNRWLPHDGLLSRPTTTTVSALMSWGYSLPRRASA